MTNPGEPPFSVKLRRISHAATYGQLQGWYTLLKAAGKAESNKSLDPMKILLSNDDASSAGEIALRLVADAFSRKAQGKIAKVDPIAHRTLQALNGYRVWKIDPQAVIAWFPRLYEALRLIHESIPPVPDR